MSERTPANQGTGYTYMTLMMSTANWHEPSTKDDPKATARTYVDDDDVEHTRYEIVFDDVVGYITGMVNDPGDFGDRLRIFMTGSEGTEFVLTVPYLHFGEGFLKIAPGINFNNIVRLNPYRMTPKDKDRDIMGISVSQPPEDDPLNDEYGDWVKIKNHYVSKDDKGKYTNLYGMPEFPDKASKDEVKLYFMQVLIFLKKTIDTLDCKAKEASHFIDPVIPNQPINDGSEVQENDLPF